MQVPLTFDTNKYFQNVHDQTKRIPCQKVFTITMDTSTTKARSLKINIEIHLQYINIYSHQDGQMTSTVCVKKPTPIQGYFLSYEKSTKLS